jgi:hypothetical protein
MRRAATSLMGDYRKCRLKVWRLVDAPDLTVLLPKRLIVFSLREAVPDPGERLLGLDFGLLKRGSSAVASVGHVHHWEIDAPGPIVRDLHRRKLLY